MKLNKKYSIHIIDKIFLIQLKIKIFNSSFAIWICSNLNNFVGKILQYYEAHLIPSNAKAENEIEL